MLHFSNLKAHADDKINATQNMSFVWERIENILGKGENAGCQHFLLFQNVFKILFPRGSLKLRTVCDLNGLIDKSYNSLL